MTSVKEYFKVIIAGGSLSGLALANMLERFDIDYVVLEAYGKIPPDVGASLTLLPNGFRILDQLGIYDEFLNQDRFTLQMYHTDVRNSTGEKFRHVEHMLEHVIAR
jgi:2-polyprenyl-6-methoxyphenol hydroxylase-like FAD-dependent oxidoreductase